MLPEDAKTYKAVIAALTAEAEYLEKIGSLIPAAALRTYLRHSPPTYIRIGNAIQGAK